MVPLVLHPLCRNPPLTGLQVDFLPPRPAHLPGPARGQDQELEAELDGQDRLGLPHRPDRGGHLPIGQRLEVPLDAALFRQRGPERLPGRIIHPVALGNCPLHHRPDPLPHPPGRRGLGVPDRRQDGHDIGRGDPIHPHPAHLRVYIVAHGRCPPGRLLGALPVRPVHGDHLGGGLLERRDGLAPGGQGIAARPGQPAVGDCGLPRLGQRHEPNRTDSQFAALAVDEKPLDPLLVSGRLDP